MAKQTAVGNEPERLVPHSEDPLLSFSECGLLVGRTHTTIRRWVEDGLLRTIREPGGLRRIRKSELVRFYGATALADATALAKAERELAAEMQKAKAFADEKLLEEYRNSQISPEDEASE